MNKSSEKELIAKLSQGNETSFREVYRVYKSEAKDWLSKHFGQDYSFEDVYQESVIALYEAALDGKLNELSCSLKTYLFAICRNQLLNSFKLQKRQDSKVDEVTAYYREWLDNDEADVEKVEMVKRTLEKMKEPCKSILILFYYQGKTIDKLAVELGYSDKNVVKVQKSRCLKYLKEQVWKK
ncbi:MAG: sigma-70 family RNA polymerase sigma factor [Bacteroidota bacterium]